MISRRGFLVSGSAVAAVSGLSLAGYAHGPGLSRARAPWQAAGQGFGDARLDALSYAILAPNPHNRQPWQFELIGDDAIDVYCDLDKRLDHTDPYDRQITIGFGCMLELLALAAAQAGYEADIVPFPDGDPYPRLSGQRMASVTLTRSEDVKPDALFQSVLQRRSSKMPYGERAVSEQALAGLLSNEVAGVTCGGTVDPARRDRLTALCWDGWMVEYETSRTRRESIDLMRICNRAIVKNPDGIDLGGMSMGLMKLVGLVGPEALDTPGSTAYKSGIKMYEPIIKSAQGYVWITAPENTRASQIVAGRAWVRLNLRAQAASICVHPLSHVLQEFSEMRALYEAAREELDVAGDAAVHMLGRIGYAKFEPPAPRWPIESKLIRI